MHSPRTVSEMFGWEVKRKRKKKKWTQSYVAEEVGITTRQLQNIESGKCDPHSSVCLSLAALLHIHLDKYRYRALQERRILADAKLAR